MKILNVQGPKDNQSVTLLPSLPINPISRWRDMLKAIASEVETPVYITSTSSVGEKTIIRLSSFY